VLESLERRYTGIRFRMLDEQDRIRPHIMIFVNDNGVRTLNESVRAMDRVQIVAALSGG
jgi:molybdopterin converting factor small subunit